MCWEVSSSNCPKFMPFLFKTHTHICFLNYYLGLLLLAQNIFKKRFLKKLWKFIGRFFGLGSPLLRLQSHCEEIIFFLPLGPQEFLYSFDWPLKLILHPPSGLNLGPLDWVLGTLNSRSLHHVKFKLHSSGKIRKMNQMIVFLFF